MQYQAAVRVVGVQMLGSFRDAVMNVQTPWSEELTWVHTALNGVAYPLNRSSVALLNVRNFPATDTRAMSSFS